MIFSWLQMIRKCSYCFVDVDLKMKKNISMNEQLLIENKIVRQ